MQPFAERIMWLSDVQEALGRIPESFNLSYDEIVGLVILLQEKRLHESYEAYKSHGESEKAQSKVASLPKPRRRL